MMTTGDKRSLLTGFVALACLQAAADESPASAEGKPIERNFTWGVSGGLGAFGFRNSLYVDKEPDAPGNLGENWAEFYIKPWANYERKLGEGVFFAKGSWAGVKTGQDAADIAGGGGSSTDIDELYVGYRGTGQWGLFEIAGGRYAYELGHGFLLSDGYADGGSRGGYWSNPRTAWAPRREFTTAPARTVSPCSTWTGMNDHSPMPRPVFPASIMSGTTRARIGPSVQATLA